MVLHTQRRESTNKRNSCSMLQRWNGKYMCVQYALNVKWFSINKYNNGAIKICKPLSNCQEPIMCILLLYKSHTIYHPYWGCHHLHSIWVLCKYAFYFGGSTKYTAVLYYGELDFGIAYIKQYKKQLIMVCRLQHSKQVSEANKLFMQQVSDLLVW